MTMKHAPAEVSAPIVTAAEAGVHGWLTGVLHYENFPVASVLVPRRLRPALTAIYSFARYADDVADEGDASPSQRLQELAALRLALEAVDGATHPAVEPLRPYIRMHALPTEDFTALLSAFEQDVRVQRYPDQAAVLDYCTRSANPIGRLMLQLFDARNRDTIALSDAICTALQLINFLQDFAIDWRRGRLYVPLDALAREGVDERTLADAVAEGRAPRPLRAVLASQAERCDALLESGAPLVRLVPGRLAWELRAILAGGRRILERLAATGFDPIATRPALRPRDALALLRLIFANRTSR